MNVLTQDLARAFLSTSTNQDKYKFFARGVQLEQLDQDYSLIKNGIDSTEAILETKVGDITELKATMDQWAEKERQLESHDTLRDRIQTMSHQMAWAQVREAELHLGVLQERLQTSQSKVTRAEEEREQASSQFENANHAHEELIKQVRIEEEKLTPLEEAKDAAKAQMDHIKKELQTLIVCGFNLRLLC
jgi:chromosome segregation ATPase